MGHQTHPRATTIDGRPLFKEQRSPSPISRSAYRYILFLLAVTPEIKIYVKNIRLLLPCNGLVSASIASVGPLPSLVLPSHLRSCKRSLTTCCHFSTQLHTTCIRSRRQACSSIACVYRPN